MDLIGVWMGGQQGIPDGRKHSKMPGLFRSTQTDSSSLEALDNVVSQYPLVVSRTERGTFCLQNMCSVTLLYDPSV